MRDGGDLENRVGALTQAKKTKRTLRHSYGPRDQWCKRTSTTPQTYNGGVGRGAEPARGSHDADGVPAESLFTVFGELGRPI